MYSKSQRLQVGFGLTTALSPTPSPLLALLFFGGLSGSFLYTGGLGLKYIALGEVVVALCFGPLTVLYAFLAQTTAQVLALLGVG